VNEKEFFESVQCIAISASDDITVKIKIIVKSSPLKICVVLVIVGRFLKWALTFCNMVSKGLRANFRSRYTKVEAGHNLE